MNSNPSISLDNSVNCHALSAVAEAQSIVQAISIENGVIDEATLERAKNDRVISSLVLSNNNLKEIADKATKALAVDLNDTLTHFVHECIQNADDNEYAEGLEPLLRILVSPQRIQLDCNEEGFTKEDVKAICNIAKSNKSVRKASEGRVGYIGEKGIGFKSVFKVAEQVYIHSPPFSFMFDKRNELGMITPRWVPDGSLQTTPMDDSQTAILLLPAAGETYDSLLNDFSVIPATLLLFLRKLKRLKLSISGLPVGTSTTSIQKTLTSKMLENGKVAILTERNDITAQTIKEEKYYIFAQTVLIDIQERRREGVNVTEFALAFPVDKFGSPRNSDQPIHAFLPIGNFGFKFLIQADFILTTNRQSVEQKLVWNCTLRNGIAHRFENAIIEFLKTPNHDLRYKWMRFLPKEINHPFWMSVEEDISKVMRSSMVLESRTGELHCPPELFFLIPGMKDRNNHPILGADSNYLSPKYESSDHALLRSLGVANPSLPWVLEQLVLLGDTVKSKGEYWHEDLAKYLQGIENKSSWTSWGPKIKQLPLILLQDGSWVSATQINSDTIYFCRGTGMVDVPTDINLRLVDPVSSTNAERNQFYRVLGVKDCDKEEVAKLILAKHQNGNVPRMDDSIAHTKYIYGLDTNIRDNLNLRGLWLYDENGKPTKGSDLYFRHRNSAEPEFSAATLFGSSEFPARFISASFGFSARTNDQQFISWLMKRTGVTDKPRLMTSGTLSTDFEYILQHFSDSVLQILKAHWSTYKQSIISNQVIRDRISSHEVRTYDGLSFQRKKLKHTFAPDPDLELASSELCRPTQRPFFLFLDSYDRSAWKFLEIFGVGFTADLRFYSWLVEQSEFRDSCTMARFRDVLKRMAILAGLNDGDQQFLRKIFLKKNILVDTTDGGIWASSTDCVWDAPDGFNKKYSVMKWYNEDSIISTLVHVTLRVSDTTVEAVVEDLKSSRPSDEYLKASTQYLVTKLKGLNDKKGLEEVVDAFKYHDFLPIKGTCLSRQKSTECFWGDPKFGGPELNHKHDLQPFYQDDPTMRTLCTSILELKAPLWADLVKELKAMKGHEDETRIMRLYGFIFSFWSGARPKWKLIEERFEKDELVFVQYSGRNFWRPPSKCAWKAPTSLLCRSAIEAQYSSCEISTLNFLQEILCIKNAGITEYIEDLELLSTGNNPDLQCIKNLYRYIDLENAVDLNIRSKFVSKRLIYNYNNTTWLSVDECVWSGPNCVQSTTMLHSLYPDSRRLFCEHLGIRDATAATLTRELSGLRAPNPENLSTEMLERIKSLLFSLSDFAKNEEGSLPSLPLEVRNILKHENFWPFRHLGSATVSLVNISKPSFIPDHPLLLELLNREADSDFPILDFQPSEVRKLDDLLVALGLESKLLSFSKREIVSATDMSDPADDLTEELRKRARALFYCAIHFKSRRSEQNDLLQMLRGIRVFRTRDISTQYEIDSQGVKRSVEATGFLRLVNENGELRVFVPTNDNLRKTGYSNCLPADMIKLLGIPESKSWRAVSALFSTEPSDEQLSLILSLHGIDHNLNEPIVTDQRETNEIAPSALLDGNTAAVNFSPKTEEKSSPIALNTTHTSSNLPQEDPIVLQSRADLQDPFIPNPRARNQVPLETEQPRLLLASKAPAPDHSHSHPNELIERRNRVEVHASSSNAEGFTVTSGHREVDIVASGSSGFDMSALTSTLPYTPPRTPSRNRVGDARTAPSNGVASHATPSTPPSGRGRSTMAPRSSSGRHDSIDVIGFEGEQFLVEALKQHLPDFNEITHWTSKLRTYAGWPALRAAEVADLTYPDTCGALTKFLAERTGEDIPGWLRTSHDSSSKWPTYYLEVKTTTSTCKEPFFISRKQYGIMEDKAVVGQGIPDEVYVILRVYNIYDDPKFQIYLDPWRLKDQPGGLRFTQDGYSVTPV